MIKVVKQEPVPVYETKCSECGSVIRYTASEAGYGSITCPICHKSITALTIRPVVKIDIPIQQQEYGYGYSDAILEWLMQHPEDIGIPPEELAKKMVRQAILDTPMAEDVYPGIKERLLKTLEEE